MVANYLKSYLNGCKLFEDVFNPETNKSIIIIITNFTDYHRLQLLCLSGIKMLNFNQ